MAFPRDGHSVYWGLKPIPLPQVAPRVRTQSHKAPSGRAVPRGLASLAITRGCCHHTPLSAQPAKCYHPEIRAFFFSLSYLQLKTVSEPQTYSISLNVWPCHQPKTTLLPTQTISAFNSQHHSHGNGWEPPSLSPIRAFINQLLHHFSPLDR